MRTELLLEGELGRALQPIRGLALANAVFAALECGLLEVLHRGAAETDNLAASLQLHPQRLQSLIDYLANEGVVERGTPPNCISLTKYGQSFLRARPWYELLVGGYANTFSQLRDALKPNAPYADRDGAYVATGSCGISQHDALPMVLELLADIPSPPVLVDLGCGDGTFIAEIAKACPSVSCIGIEPDAGARDIALQRARGFGLTNLRVLPGEAMHLPPELDSLPPDTAFLTAFVLQELLEQSGESEIVALLDQTFTNHPEASWLVVEVDRRDSLSDLPSPLALSYYNPYYLLHGITQQRLIPMSAWKNIYEKAGVDLVAESRPDPQYDSLGLKVGHLLQRKIHT